MDRYEEALARAKQGLPIDQVFPELAESEDERIRKNCVHFLELQKEHHADTFEIDECISYLEKQKKPARLELKAGKWYICHTAYCCRADSLTVKEGERFMCEKDGIVKGFVIKKPEKYFKECSAPAPMEEEQKPAEWSEEDVRMLNSIIATCQLAAQDRGSGPAKHLFEMQERFLKSLRPQPKAELDAIAKKESYKNGFLSARDILSNMLMRYLDGHRPDGMMCLSNGECKDIKKAFEAGDWEKIIRYVNKYQPHWKPSDIQMAALKYATTYVPDDEGTLASLFRDLENLK